MPELNWIPVTDRRPPNGTPVLICRRRPGGELVVEQGCRDVNGWWKVYGTRTKSVTHWMPLPTPPATEEVPPCK